jgi:hypothetical protein
MRCQSDATPGSAAAMQVVRRSEAMKTTVLSGLRCAMMKLTPLSVGPLGMIGTEAS